MIRQLKPHEQVKYGDLVSVNQDSADRYRPLRGLVGRAAGEYWHPVYRADPESFEAGSYLDATFATDQYRDNVEFNIQDNDPESDNSVTTTIYGGEIRKLAEWLTQCAEAIERQK